MSLTPGQAIRKFCLKCAGSSNEVATCQGDQLLSTPCPLFKYRKGRGRPSVKIIRKHCLHCCNDSYREVSECPDLGCTLYVYRFGTNPNYPKDYHLKGKKEVK